MDIETLAKAMFLAYYREEDDPEVWTMVDDFVKVKWRDIAASVMRQLPVAARG